VDDKNIKITKTVSEIEFVCSGHSTRVDQIITDLKERLKIINPSLAFYFSDGQKEC